MGVKKIIIKVEKNVGVKIKSGWKKMKIGCEKIAYMGQNMLLLEAHTYKWLISIFKEIASVLLFGLGVKCLEIELF